MYGKIFESMFKGSMMGAGPSVMSAWSYAIAHQKPTRSGGVFEMVVELNPELMAFQIGDKLENVLGALKYLCSPDKKRPGQEEDGRRMVHLGGYLYRVVNGVKYREIRDAEERKAQLREAQRKHRAKKMKSKGPLPGELLHKKAEAAGASPEQLQAMVEATLPEARGGEANEQTPFD
jgi:hypothetical protein